MNNVTAGTPTNATFTFTVQVPQYCPTGTYSITLILYDSIGNRTSYTAPQLQSMGFLSSIAISSTPLPPVDVPSVVGLSQAAATSLITGAGLSVGR